MLVTLYPHQEILKQATRQKLSEGFRSPLIVSPTGSGKTCVFCNIAEAAQSRKNYVYILVHRQELIRQTSEHLTRLAVPHGCISPDYSRSDSRVQVASVQTIVRRMDGYPAPDLIISDECHHDAARSRRTILDRWKDAIILGFTATPCRLDGAGLGKASGGYYDCMVPGPSTRWLIDNGHLSQPVVYVPPADIDLSQVKISMGDFDQNEIALRMDKKQITGCAIENYRKYCPGEPAIAFCASVQHAEHVASDFRAAGIPSESIDGHTPYDVRVDRINALGDGRISVLTNYNLISEGTDVPRVSAIIGLRPTASLGLAIQQWGRGLRIFPGKKQTTILDHAGNCIRHGMLPDDDVEWSLDAPKESTKKRIDKMQEKALSLRLCEKCYCAMKSFKLKCPQCGFVHRAVVRPVTITKGDLVRMTKERAEAESARKKAEEKQAASLADYLAIAKQRGYNPKWAHIRFGLKSRKKNFWASRISTPQLSAAGSP